MRWFHFLTPLKKYFLMLYLWKIIDLWQNLQFIKYLLWRNIMRWLTKKFAFEVSESFRISKKNCQALLHAWCFHVINSLLTLFKIILFSIFVMYPRLQFKNKMYLSSRMLQKLRYTLCWMFSKKLIKSDRWRCNYLAPTFRSSGNKIYTNMHKTVSKCSQIHPEQSLKVINTLLLSSCTLHFIFLSTICIFISSHFTCSRQKTMLQKRLMDQP